MTGPSWHWTSRAPPAARTRFGQALDVAFRLLDGPTVKTAHTAARDPLLLVVSGDIYHSVVRGGHDGLDPGPFRNLVSAEIAGIRFTGWIYIPG